MGGGGGGLWWGLGKPQLGIMGDTNWGVGRRKWMPEGRLFDSSGSDVGQLRGSNRGKTWKGRPVLKAETLGFIHANPLARGTPLYHL